MACAMSSADPRRRAFEEHVLDEVRDAAAVGGFVPRAARQPDADADRTHLRHLLGEDAEAVIENVSNDRRIRQGEARSRNAGASDRAGPTCRKVLTEKGLPARNAHYNMGLVRGKPCTRATLADLTAAKIVLGKC